MKFSLYVAVFAMGANAVVSTQVRAAGKANRPVGNRAPTLSLDAYLGQVKEQNVSFKASDETVRAAQDRSSDGDLMNAPTVFASVQNMADAKEQAVPASMGDHTTATTANVGVSKMFDFGLQAKVSYTANRVKIDGVSPQFLPVNEYLESKPMLELTQPLWRNAFGRESNTQKELITSQLDLTKQTEILKRNFVLMDAELAYWRLSLAREALAATNDNLERAIKTKKWSENRANLQLADKADYYQAEALVRARKLELEAAIDEEQSAVRAFNTLRSTNNSTVSEDLTHITPEMLGQLKIPVRSGSRADTLAAQQAVKLSQLNAKLAKEKYVPTLEAFGSFAANGRDDSSQDAFTESLGPKHPTTIIGVRLSAPLGRNIIDRSVSAANRDALAASFSADRKKYEDERSWAELNAGLGDAKRRLELMRSIEEIQKQKLDHERQRHQNGRSTMFQVLTFEQDFASAELSRIRAQADVLRFVAQLRTWNSDDSGSAK